MKESYALFDAINLFVVAVHGDVGDLTWVDTRDVMQSLLRGCDEFRWVRLKLRLSTTWRGNLLGLQPCRMSMKMDGARVQDVHKEYNGPQYEIKTRTTELAMEAGYAQTTPFHVVTTLIFRLCSLN
ncbi:hypothetical protein Tco_0528211 [Tanacetum coccineum]